MMARRVLGGVAIALACLMVWLTYAVYTKVFVDTVDVTLQTSKIGLQLNPQSDVKLRGIIVGTVKKISTDGDGATIKLGLKPELTGLIPRGVSARILPKTLFGEKFVSLVPPAGTATRPIRRGDVIRRDQTTVGIEVEKVLNDALPLLQALEPADLNATLNALATALEGRGAELGRTLVRLDGYLKKFNPQLPTLVDDLKRLVVVGNLYRDVADDIIQVLRDAVFTGNTVTEKEPQLQKFFADVTTLANHTDQVLEDNEDRLIRLGEVSRPVLRLLEWYAPTIKCTLQTQADNLPSIRETFREGMLHINLILLTNQPTPYNPDERPVYGERWAYAADAKPPCPGRNFEFDGYPGPYTSQNPPPLTKQNDGVKGGHHKVRDDELVDARKAANGDGNPNTGPASSGYPGTEAEQRMVNAILGPAMGVPADEVPDLATLMFGPLARGSQVSMR
jgi:phospholipid/cholesterol/gamma-HCH transport system substrate-binding protein